MWWAIGDVLAFLLLIGVVVALARPRTARWERDQHAAEARRRHTLRSPGRRVRGAARLHGRVHTVQRRRVHRHP